MTVFSGKKTLLLYLLPDAFSILNIQILHSNIVSQTYYKTENQISQLTGNQGRFEWWWYWLKFFLTWNFMNSYDIFMMFPLVFWPALNVHFMCLIGGLQPLEVQLCELCSLNKVIIPKAYFCSKGVSCFLVALCGSYANTV